MTLRWHLRLADAADAISLPRFRAADLQVTAKPDLTPVSDADLAVERAIRALLAAERRRATRSWGRSSGVRPRRFGRSRPRRWVLDPIDGTKNFVRGVPVWATLIALFDGDDVVVGVVSAPGAGPAVVGGRRARRLQPVRAGAAAATAGCPAVAELADASLSYSESAEWRAAGLSRRFAALCEACWRTRAYGDFYSYMLVAEGAVDVAAEPELSLWDVAALIPIVTEAGGTIDGNRRSAIRRHRAQRAGLERTAARAGAHAAEQVNQPQPTGL